MIMRDLTISDLVQLESQAQFPLENLVHKPKIIQKTFEDEKGIIGSVIVNGTVEISILLNGRSKRDKIKFLREVFDFLYRELMDKGYRDAHVFITNPEYADILVKHFGFEDVNGRALVRRSKDG